MASEIITFPHLTPKEIKSLKEIVYLGVISDGQLNELVTVKGGVKTGDREAWLDPMSMVGKKSRKCDPECDEALAPLIEKEWNLKEWDSRLCICYADLEDVLYDLGLKDGVMRGDLTNTEYSQLLETLYVDALEKMYHRFTWFGDTDASHVEDGGIIVDDADLDFFNVVDGVFKQIEELIADGNSEITNLRIEANYEASREAQMDYDWSAVTTLRKALLSPKPLLKKQKDTVVYVSGFFMNKLKLELLERPEYTSEQFALNVLGFNTVNFLGYEITEMLEWDEAIETFLKGADDPAAAYDRPFRVLVTTKSNLVVGVPSEETFLQMNAWYERKDRKMYMEAMDKLDVLLMLPRLVTIAW